MEALCLCRMLASDLAVHFVSSCNGSEIGSHFSLDCVNWFRQRMITAKEKRFGIIHTKSPFPWIQLGEEMNPL